MKDIRKKLLGALALTACTATAFAFASCKDDEPYTGEKLPGYVSTESEAISNGGFAVKKDGYVYFINGVESSDASNEYGAVEKGALMRIAETDLASGAFDKVDTVVPMLFVAQNYDAGIYIYGDYVYFATPTTDKNMEGDVESGWIDFKRAKLDGSEAMSDYYFRLEDNTTAYRFVTVGDDDTVYCMYEEDGALKSYNTKTDKHTTLVDGAKSSFYYDKNDPANPNVYYTMAVQDYVKGATAASYDQIYCVNAAATVESVNSSAASYTVKGGKTYDFDKAYLEDEHDGFSAGDYTTYPYVNLGTLVLDGVGINSEKTQFNASGAPVTADGYTYTISSHQNGGVYFTRSEVTKTSSDATDTKLYYLADASWSGAEWNAVSGNEGDKVEVVALNTTNTANALFYIDNGEHWYLYLTSDNSTLVKESEPVNGVTKKVDFRQTLSGASLWQIRGDYLYYYTGNDISKIKYTGSQEDYDLNTPFESEDAEFEATKILGVEWNTGWYKPEFFDGLGENKKDIVLYAGAQTFGSGSAYNYIYAVETDAQAVKANNEKYQKVLDYIDEYSDDSVLQNLMNYYFKTGETAAYEDVKDLYDNVQQKAFDDFVALFKDSAAAEDKLALQSTVVHLVGEMTADDKDDVKADWVDFLKKEDVEETEEESGMPTWAVWLIACGSALVVLVAAFVIVKAIKKKKAAKREAEETVNAYKRKKIDTTDDKSIDVYADETEETVKETATETVEETAEAEEPATSEVSENAEEKTEE